MKFSMDTLLHRDSAAQSSAFPLGMFARGLHGGEFVTSGSISPWRCSRQVPGRVIDLFAVFDNAQRAITRVTQQAANDMGPVAVVNNPSVRHLVAHCASAVLCCNYREKVRLRNAVIFEQVFSLFEKASLRCSCGLGRLAATLFALRVDAVPMIRRAMKFTCLFDCAARSTGACVCRVEDVYAVTPPALFRFVSANYAMAGDSKAIPLISPKCVQGLVLLAVRTKLAWGIILWNRSGLLAPALAKTNKIIGSHVTSLGSLVRGASGLITAGASLIIAGASL